MRHFLLTVSFDANKSRGSCGFGKTNRKKTEISNTKRLMGKLRAAFLTLIFVSFSNQANKYLMSQPKALQSF